MNEGVCCLDVMVERVILVLETAFWGCLRHAEGTVCLQRFPGFFCALICVIRCLRVSLSLAAAQRVVLLLKSCEVGVWWWFENSRACLYYFFIVNDCQSDACLLVCSGGCPRGLNGVGVLCERFFFLIKDFSRLFCFESLFFGLSS